MNIPDSETILLITRYGMGDAEPELQLKLVSTYLQLLVQSKITPAAICMYTNGVRLAVEGSPVINALASLEARGCRLILCSTCLGYMDLTSKVQVGIAGSMADIIDATLQAGKVISL